MSEGPSGDEPVGSVGEEAAKLFGALADWAGEHVGDVDEHLATGSTECLYCPVCRTVHAVRNASPELKAQLTTAASSFLQAAAGLLSAAGTTPPPAQPRVQTIDLDGDPDGEDLS
ncbi:hypothetical protein G5V58_06920 [Nocardioides anomalus]|uniref:Uncharacterized protein n=1 Tax=Nocardioides anomalus TaxID=2712223 RepID=A0A6G6WBL6_9ACTN|nr:hypothetical protein [Nocardioides anomalus]QIG42543.1 hypothetical protein G5V58_06920 [Nocardioides anomalus]